MGNFKNATLHKALLLKHLIHTECVAHIPWLMAEQMRTEADSWPWHMAAAESTVLIFRLQLFLEVFIQREGGLFTGLGGGDGELVYVSNNLTSCWGKFLFCGYSKKT